MKAALPVTAVLQWLRQRTTWVPGQIGLQGELQVSLGYRVKSCLNNTKQKGLEKERKMEIKNRKKLTGESVILLYQLLLN